MTEKKVQPGPVPQMVINGNRNVKNLPVDSNGKRDWSFDICGCCGDCGACCCACWCPCLVNAKNHKRLDYLNKNGYPYPRRDEMIVGDDGCLYAFIQVCCDMGWVLQIGIRRDVRERYGIRGNNCGDTCSAAFCTMCDLVQVHRELKLEEDNLQQSLNASTP